MERGNAVTRIESCDDKVWVTTTYTINLGNYENLKIEAGMNRTILPGENPLDLIDRITDNVLRRIINKAKTFHVELSNKNK